MDALTNNSFIHLVSLWAREFYRQPASLFWALAFPVALAWVLGVAFSPGEPGKIKVGIVASAKENRSLDKKLKVLPGADRFAFFYGNQDSIDEEMRRGRIKLWVEQPLSEQPLYHFDPVNPEAKTAYLLLDRVLLKQPAPAEDPRVQALTRPGSRYIDFLIPGLIAFGVLNSCMWGLGWGLIERRMKKMLRRLVATPMARASYLAAAGMVRLGVTTAELFILYGFATYFFDVKMQGSWLAIALLMVGGNLAFGGIAIIAGSRVDGTIEGNGIINAVTLPMMMLSGIFFDYQNFPAWSHFWIQLLPLTLLADGLRSVFVEAAGVAEVARQALAPGLTGLGCGWIGLKMFKWY